MPSFQSRIPDLLTRTGPLVAALLLIPFAVPSCAPDHDGEERTTCVPGRAILCYCASGATGQQRCQEDGTRYGPCDCSDSGADVGPVVSDATFPWPEGGGGDVWFPGDDVTCPDAGPDVCDAGPPVDAGPTADAGVDSSPDTFCLGGLIRDRLSDGTSSGQVNGGSWVIGSGWKTSSRSDRITWDVGSAVTKGKLSFTITGVHANVSGCLMGVCYYVGLFDEPNGDKKGDYTGSAFIESRFHTNDQENFHDVFKLQAGTGNGEMLEPLTTPMGWNATEAHDIRIEWGPDPSNPSRGRAWLFLDGQLAPLNYQAFYNNPDVPWRFLFLGTTRYKGLDWGMVGVTYRDVCLQAL